MAGLLLFNFPLLSTANRLLMLWGIPVLFLYLFLAWLLVIVSIALGTRRSRQSSVQGDGSGDEKPR